VRAAAGLSHSRLRGWPLCLAGAVAAAAIAAGPAGAPAAPAECAWQRHSKPVVKQLRRHGQLKRVRRVKHWWTCDAQATAFAPAAALPLPKPAPEAAASEEPAPQVSHLGVKAVEWSYTLSRPEVSAGEVVVELNNQGEDPHNLKLRREGSEEPPLVAPEAAAAEIKSARFNLSPGTYHLYCSLYQHEEKGMHATLLVAAG
jgi:plastocyanin